MDEVSFHHAPFLVSVPQLVRPVHFWRPLHCDLIVMRL
jgi:hypothetical protein